MKPLLIALLLCSPVLAQTTPTTNPYTIGVGNLPHLSVDVKNKTLRMDCESLNIDGPLEFLCCRTGTNEYESVLRSDVRPSHLHFGLLMLGLEPGRGIHFDQEKQKWVPPSGPPLKLSVEFEKNGKTITLPAEQLMREIKTKEPMPEVTWVFTGSRIVPGKRYAADATGYLVSVVNFELSPVDFPALESSSNDTLEWETNKAVAPPAGTKVTLIFQPAEKVKPPPHETGTKPPATGRSP